MATGLSLRLCDSNRSTPSWGAGLTLVVGSEYESVDQLQGGSDEGHEANRVVILHLS